jgi:hypothetical protein
MHIQIGEIIGCINNKLLEVRLPVGAKEFSLPSTASTLALGHNRSSIQPIQRALLLGVKNMGA